MQSLFNFHDFVVIAGSIRNQFTNIFCGSLFRVVFSEICISCASIFVFESRRIILSLTGGGALPGDQLPFKTNLHLKCITKSCAHNAIFWQSHAAIEWPSWQLSWVFGLAGFQIANQLASKWKTKMKKKMENAGGFGGGTHTALSPFWQLLIIATWLGFYFSLFLFFLYFFRFFSIFCDFCFVFKVCRGSCNCHLLFDHLDQWALGTQALHFSWGLSLRSSPRQNMG